MSTSSTTRAADDARVTLAERPMTAFQFGIVAVLFCLNGLDGFDALAISFAAPGITSQWGISTQALGVVISLGLLATGLGSLLVAPLADRIGRRPMIFLTLASMTLGMALSSIATGITTLAIGRAFTGLGVGALVPVISALTSEYCNRRYKDFGVIVMAIGFPVGGLVGGLGAALLLQHFDWHAVFIAGAIASAVLALLPLLWVPESIEYLLSRRPADSLGRINAILRRLGQPETQALPPQSPSAEKQSTFDIVTRPALLMITLTITVAYALHGATLYYSLNWIPKIVVDLQLSQPQAAAIAGWCSGGGIVGSLLAAWLATRMQIRFLCIAALFGAGLLLAAFAHTPGEIASLTLASLLLGACLYGAQVSLYALMTRSFPVHVRATGVGFVTGAGRLGAIISPLASGQLLGIGLSYSQVSSFMALGSALGAIVLLLSAHLSQPALPREVES
ncbi:MAG TPA: MFS transporter [Steroidobacteraceae bacterium]